VHDVYIMGFPHEIIESLLLLLTRVTVKPDWRRLVTLVCVSSRILAWQSEIHKEKMGFRHASTSQPMSVSIVVPDQASFPLESGGLNERFWPL
jgi:hypothetical protein